MPVRFMGRGFTTVTGMLAAGAMLLTGVLGAGTVPAATARAPEPEVVSLLRVSTPSEERVADLVGTGLDLAEHRTAGSVEVFAHGQQDMRRLRQAGFDYTVVIPDLAAHTREVLAEDEARARTMAPSDLPSGRNTYRTYADYGTELAGLVAERPDLVKPIELPHKSLLGKTVRGVEIGHNVAARDGRPVFLLVGNHHAREWPTAEVAMEFAIDLVRSEGEDPRITGLLRQARIIVVPIVNPDGFDISRSYITEYKRKNCRVTDGEGATPAQCADADNARLGVDLNRNYGVNWGGVGASTNPASQTYRGAGPFSEPEVRNVVDLVSERQVTSLQSVHNYGGLVLRPPQQSTTPLTADEETYAAIGADLGDATGYHSIPSYQLYDTSGSTGEWAYFTTGTFGFEFELGGNNFHIPYQRGVIDQYFGTGSATGADGGVREALLRQFEVAADRQYHSVITGKAPRGARLSLEKTFTQYTAPVLRPDGSAGHRLPFHNRLTSTMTASGAFTWDVNPSVRPDRTGHTIAESWTLRCARPNGTVLQEVRVTAERGERVSVDLSRCAARWRR
ncbi:M14 family metallopeptidase [Amycolatopsis cihanbeyliensis]|uniref:Zinc carboxypeptidase n=1 Tax=Amycolatopsis cihanbeyliensis TaxID=1128664 RepID=A0A542DIM5_AMYCI|nr:M14 family metallopeptidase [Amycolatopsis cihanbeyliensis]TQJ02949.1 zinc carboxypeptidase [Amycolatopsis cihanbeyliensis]